MGCNNSKSTDTKDGSKPKNGEDTLLTVKEAEDLVVKELCVSEERAKKMVEKVDKNGDGKISKNELIELQKKINEAQEALRPKFESVDKDKTGYVETDEAMMILAKTFQGVKEDQLKLMIKRYDDNGDGKINFKEFIYFYSMIMARREFLIESFNQLDKEDTGKLDQDAVAQLLITECVLEEKMARSLVEDYDMNKDGKLDKAEFNTLWMQMFDKKEEAEAEAKEKEEENKKEGEDKKDDEKDNKEDEKDKKDGDKDKKDKKDEKGNKNGNKKENGKGKK